MPKEIQKKSIGGYSVQSIMNVQSKRQGRLELYTRTPQEESDYMQAIADYNKDPSNLKLRQRVFETMNP